jgi:uncharacterized RDD family membrane protein YckC
MPDHTSAESTPSNHFEPPARYATFTRRFRALVIDSAIVSGLVIALLFLGDAVAGVRGSAQVIWLLAVGLLLLYEPVLVSRRGATLGHSVARLQVVDARTGRWPSFARSLARYLIKVVVGAPSFVTMALTRRHQAVHDLLTQTTVQVPATEDFVEFHVERAEEPGVELPSRRRRLAVILLYVTTVFFVYGVTLTLVVPADCLQAQSCAAGTRILVQAIALAWLGLSLAAIVAGWRGVLFGARRTRRSIIAPA